MRGMFAILTIVLIAASSECFAQQNLAQSIVSERQSYGLAEKIPFTYSVRNNSIDPITYDFSSSKQFDLWVTLGDQELFRLSRSRMYAQMLTSFTLQRGETKTFCAEWNQKDNSGRQVGPGSYTVYARLTPSSNPPPAASMNVRVGIRGATLVPMTIKEAISNFSASSGKKILISAVYKGWAPNPGDPNIKDGPPVNRSNWAICDGTGCMYVVGSINLDPAKDVDTKITVVGKLQKTDKGQVYMILESATVNKKSCNLRET